LRDGHCLAFGPAVVSITFSVFMVAVLGLLPAVFLN